MGKQLAAVIGVGQTHHRAKREDVSIAGLCREAVDRALADAGLGFDDIDAVVVGKAPDTFEGVANGLKKTDRVAITGMGSFSKAVKPAQKGGKKAMEPANLKPERTMRSFKEDKEALKRRTR